MADACLCTAGEESKCPKRYGDEQHDPQDMRCKAEPTEQREDQEQHDKRNHCDLSFLDP
jgi:hypothetical protein